MRFVLNKKKKEEERQENETKTNTDNIISHNEASCQMISFSMFIKCFACTQQTFKIALPVVGELLDTEVVCEPIETREDSENR